MQIINSALENQTLLLDNTKLDGLDNEVDKLIEKLKENPLDFLFNLE